MKNFTSDSDDVGDDDDDDGVHGEAEENDG